MICTKQGWDLYTTSLFLNQSCFISILSANQDEPKDDSVEVSHLRQQLATLTASLGTLSQEKSKMEANFLAEKKAIKVRFQGRIYLLGHFRCNCLKEM